MQIEFVSPEAGPGARTVLAIPDPEGQASSLSAVPYPHQTPPTKRAVVSRWVAPNYKNKKTLIRYSLQKNLNKNI